MQQGSSGRVDGDEVRVAGREPVDENRAEEVNDLCLCLHSRGQELRARDVCCHGNGSMIEFVAKSAAKY